MNITKLFTLLFVFSSLHFYAQDDSFREKKQQIKAMKVAFITGELNLTSSEAEKFWPIYNTFDEKQFELRHQKMRGYYKKIQDTEFDKLTEKEANVLLNQIQDSEEQLFDLRMKFTANLKEILPSVKILRLKKAEEDFNRKLLKQYKNKGAK